MVSVEGVEVAELCEDFGLTGLPYLPCQEHLVHHSIHLQGQTAGDARAGGMGY